MEIVKETLTDIVFLDYFEGNPGKPFWGGAVKKMIV